MAASRAQKWVFSAILILLLLAAAEFVAYTAGGFLAHRGVFYSPQPVARFDEYMEQRDAELGWIVLSGTSADVDESGSRVVPAFPEIGNACMSMYGSSFTWGAEVDNAHAWHNLLSEKMGCRVANYAVGGWGSDQALMRFLRKRDDEAQIVILGHATVTILRNVNQYRRLLTPANQYGLKPRFVLDERGELRTIPLPTFSKEEFAKVTQWPDRYLEHEYYTLENPTIVRLLRFPYTLSVLSAFGDFRVKAELSGRPGHSEFYSPDHASNGLAITVGILARFQEVAQERGQSPLPLIIPIGSDFEYFVRTGEWVFQPLIDELSERGVEAFNAGPGMVERLEEGRDPCEFVTTSCSGHFNEEGYALLAETVHAELGRRGYLARLAERRRPADSPPTH